MSSTSVAVWAVPLVTAYKAMIENAENARLPPLGFHMLMGVTALQKTRNAARNIEEGRTHPIQALCRKPEADRG